MIGIIGAMEIEIQKIKEQIKDCTHTIKYNIDFYHGTLEGIEVVLVRSGVGKVNASFITTLLLSHFPVTCIINTGIAGGIFPAQSGDIVLADALCYGDVDVSAFGYDLGNIPEMPLLFPVSAILKEQCKKELHNMNATFHEGIVLTSDAFITATSMLLHQPKNTLAVEMEGAAIAHVCYRAGIPFLSLRFISDEVGSSLQQEEYLKFEQQASHTSANLCIQLIQAIA